MLIITYYWPPSGGVGVQRWLKFSKYLPSNNWAPVIYTPANPEFNIRDESLLDNISEKTLVLKQPIREPFQIYSKIFGRSGASTRQGIVSEGKSQSFLEKITIWIRGNLFLPDARRSWVKPSIKFLTNYLENNPVDIVVTTGPPHSIHLIGLGLKNNLGIKWIADFRDPWSQWDVLPRLRTSDYAMRVHRKLEKRVCSSCDLLITVSPRLEKMYAPLCKHVKTVTNGFDFDDNFLSPKSEKFRICHAGLLNETKNIKTFWEVLQALCAEEDGFKNDLEISLAGNISSSILDNLADSPLHDNVVDLGYLSHSDVHKLYRESFVLLLFLNQTPSAPFLLPSKLFEYLHARRFILALGPSESDANDILIELNYDELIDFENYESIKLRLMGYYLKYKSGSPAKLGVDIGKYSRESLTKKLAQTFDELINAKD